MAARDHLRQAGSEGRTFFNEQSSDGAQAYGILFTCFSACRRLSIETVPSARSIPLIAPDVGHVSSALVVKAGSKTGESQSAQRLRNTVLCVNLHTHRLLCNNLQQLCCSHSSDIFLGGRMFRPAACLHNSLSFSPFFNLLIIVTPKKRVRSVGSIAAGVFGN